MTPVSPGNNRLLLEIMVPFYDNGTELLVEAQALNGIKLWSEHFYKVTVCAYVIKNKNELDEHVWASPKALLAERNIVLEPLPNGFHPINFIKYKPQVAERFRALIPEHDYLCFGSIGGIGHWGNVAADIAIEQQRDYSVWFDYVLDDLPIPDNVSMIGKIKRICDRMYGKMKTEHVIKKSRLGLFHGKSVFDGYAKLADNPQLVHDIHISQDDVIDSEKLAQKLAKLPNKSKIHLGYVGRVMNIKGPEDWIDIVAKVVDQIGPDRVQATWLGNGPMFSAMVNRIKQQQLQDVISFKGFVDDHAKILEFLQSIDVFLFCHISAESPRCLIEAIISGTPLVGYTSPYAKDLVGKRGGALLSNIGDVDTVANQIVQLAEDPQKLTRLTENIAKSSPLYHDQAVFQHRSDLIKTYL